LPDASRHIFTSESVTEGHPDKVCDQISDAILDAALAQDPMSRVACETLVTTNRCVIAGEITTSATIDYEAVTRKAIEEIGYTDPEIGFDAKTCEFYNFVHTQSGDIAMGVDTGGAGDQGLMFGYACDETPELMPLPIMLAHRLTRRLSEARRSGDAKYLRPDGKSQVSVEYINGKPARIDAIVVSTQHEDMPIEELRRLVKAAIIDELIPAHMVDANTNSTSIRRADSSSAARMATAA
jgi:S-adenosylmethionine synthetase